MVHCRADQVWSAAPSYHSIHTPPTSTQKRHPPPASASPSLTLPAHTSSPHRSTHPTNPFSTIALPLASTSRLAPSIPIPAGYRGTVARATHSRTVTSACHAGGSSGRKSERVLCRCRCCADAEPKEAGDSDQLVVRIGQASTRCSAASAAARRA